jgi:hypothetical protein
MPHRSLLPAALALFATTACIEKENRSPVDAATGNETVETNTVPTKFVPQCTDDAKCAGSATCSDGVCVPKPGADHKAKLTDPTHDYTDANEAPALDCVGKSVDDLAKGLPDVKTVTMWGRVDRFGGGDVTAGIEVAVFKASEFKPEACAGIADKAKRDACFVDDSKVGKPLATTVSIDAAKAKDAGLNLAGHLEPGQKCEKHLDCGNGYECRKPTASIDKVCVLTHGVFALEGVPTNTPLVVRVHGPQPNLGKWHDSYLWDLVLFSDRLDGKGAGKQPAKYEGKDTFRMNPTIVGEGQWKLVPNTIGIGSIEEGNGVIGGRIRDCGKGGGRRGWPINKAKVALGVPAAGLAFFNDEEDNTVPVNSSSVTDRLGRYAAVDIPPGANRVAATASIDGKIVALGGIDVFVIPDALVIVSLPGRVAELTK